MRKISFVILAVLLFSVPFYSQSRDTSGTEFVFLPSGLNFMPLKAGIDEAKMGLLYFTASNNMKVDIGNSFDVFAFKFKESRSELSVGAEFMAYAYVTNFLQYRLQIDAVDGFFGGNVTYSKRMNDGRFITRFRYIHSSAHLVDGHWDAVNGVWRYGDKPTPYGNNYGEILLAREDKILSGSLMYYGGTAMSTGQNTGGRDLKRFTFKTGFEFQQENIIGKILGRSESLFAAVNLDFKGIPKYIVNQNYMAGIKLGKWDDKGIMFYISYYNGGDVFNQYFNRRVSRFGAGFFFDFM